MKQGFSAAARSKLLQMLDESLVDRLESRVTEDRARQSGPKPAAPLYKATAKRDLEGFADLSVELVRLIETSALAPAIGMLATLSNRSGGTLPAGWEPAYVTGRHHTELPSAALELLARLRELRSLAKTALETLDGTKSAPQWCLPASGRPPSPASLLVTCVMHDLFLEGVELTAGRGRDAKAVPALEIVLEEAGYKRTDAQAQVRKWLAQHPPAPRGGRYMSPPASDDPSGKNAAIMEGKPSRSKPKTRT